MVFAIAGLSGVGKTTVAKKISELLEINLCLTFTTRPMRNTEKQGVDYHFIKDETYESLVKDDKIVAKESFDTDYGIWKYGLNKNDLLKDLCCVVVLNPNGINDLKKENISVTSICIEVDEKERMKRIFKRNDNQPKNEIKRRTKKDYDMFKNYDFDFRVKNYDLNECVKQITHIIFNTMSKEHKKKINKFLANKIKN